MKNPGELKISRREPLLGTATSVAVLAVPVIAALHRRVARDRPGAGHSYHQANIHSGLVKKKE